MHEISHNWRLFPILPWTIFSFLVFLHIFRISVFLLVKFNIILLIVKVLIFKKKFIFEILIMVSKRIYSVQIFMILYFSMISMCPVYAIRAIRAIHAILRISLVFVTFFDTFLTLLLDLLVVLIEWALIIFSIFYFDSIISLKRILRLNRWDLYVISIFQKPYKLILQLLLLRFDIIVFISLQSAS